MARVSHIITSLVTLATFSLSPLNPVKQAGGSVEACCFKRFALRLLVFQAGFETMKFRAFRFEKLRLFSDVPVEGFG